MPRPIRALISLRAVARCLQIVRGENVSVDEVAQAVGTVCYELAYALAAWVPVRDAIEDATAEVFDAATGDRI